MSFQTRALWYSRKHMSKTDTEEKKLMNKSLVD